MTKRSLFLVSLFSAVTAICSAQDSASQVFMTVGDQPVTLNEFKVMYYNNLSKDSLKSPKALVEYLDLFIDFRLKVNAALDARIDTTPSFKQEMGEYREKLAEPRMRDTAVENKLIQEAYERTKWDVRAEHILIKVAPDASPEDTMLAYKEMMKIREKIVKGDTTFEDAARKYSSDTYSKRKGRGFGIFYQHGNDLSI